MNEIAATTEALTVPHIERLRLETRRRRLTVLSTARISPKMLRLRVGGPELSGQADAPAKDF